MNKIKPYNDKKMTLNDDGLYELTLEKVKQDFGNPFADDGVLSTRIKRNTRNVYNYIFAHSNSANRQTIINIINKTEEYRKFIYDCLITQMESDMASGYNDNALYVPQSLDQRMMQHINSVCVGVEQIIDNSIGYGGINLCYMGTFSFIIINEFKD